MSSSASSANSFKSAREDQSPVMLLSDVPRPITTGTRSRLPVPQPEKNNANFWSFLKHCIGKELSKITMPVQWNEPLSFLQRLSEYMNYSYLLRLAADLDDPERRMRYVAAFAVSALSSNLGRMGKPFNPLLGETYELCGDDFRIMCEQVGHHPPMSAFHAEGGDGEYVFHGSLYPKVKFWGKSIEFTPKGTMSIFLPRWNETYTWSNVNCIVHNIIVGSLWMEHQGAMEIVNETTGHRCVLTFKPGGWFSDKDDLHFVEGFTQDPDGQKKSFLYGRWTEYLCVTSVSSLEALFDGLRIDKVDSGGNGLPKHEPFILGAVPNSEVLWEVDIRGSDADKYYNFSPFTMGLNEMLQDQPLCSTDSRLRPDIRALELGDLERASQEKERLENKQREYRKPFKNKKENEWWTPIWFTAVRNEKSKDLDWKFKGDYWQRKFDKVPDIF